MYNVKRSAGIVFCSAGMILSALLTACGGGDQGRDPILGMPSSPLVSLTITPPAPSVAAGNSLQLVATAAFADGSSREVTTTSSWISATPAVATVGAATGMAKGITVGTSSITATYGTKSASTVLNVTPAVVTSIAVAPATANVAVGASRSFIATATYSDATTGDISASAAWTSGTVAVASVLPGGSATGITAGTSTITATSGGKSGQAILTVSAVAPAITGVDLKSAASFAVLAGTSITNNAGGTTLVTGDVGAASQTVDPVQTAGYANYKSGPILAGALADLQTAILDAKGRTCDVNSASGINLGGLTFGPGVYCYAGAITLTGTFTMNGAGLYIFRTASTFNTSANSIVALNGGATAANVIWVPVQPTTLGANSVFKGTIMGAAAAITVGDNATLLNGRVLSGAAVTLSNNQIAK